MTRSGGRNRRAGLKVCHCPSARGAYKVAAQFAGSPRMARDQVDMTTIESREELVAWFEAGIKPKSQFRLGTEQRVCRKGDVLVVPGGVDHEAWFREDAEVIDFFAPPREDFLVGGKPSYMSNG